MTQELIDGTLVEEEHGCWPFKYTTIRRDIVKTLQQDWAQEIVLDIIPKL